MNDLFLLIDSILVAQICRNFRDSFLQEHARVTSFLQSDKPITCEQNVIYFGGYFIYGGDFMNHRCQHEGNIQRCFADLKLYFFQSKLIQSLFKSVFI